MKKLRIDVANLATGDVVSTAMPAPEGRIPIDFQLFCNSNQAIEAAARFFLTLLDEAGNPVDEGFGAILNPLDSRFSEWVIGASPTGEQFTGELNVTQRVRRVHMRWASNVPGGLVLARGRLQLEARTVAPHEQLELSITVTSAVSESRALLLIPQFLDDAHRPLPPPFEGFASSDLHPAYAYLSCAPSGRTNQLRIRAPDRARFLSLRLRPWRGVGRFLLEERRHAVRQASQANRNESEDRGPVFRFEGDPNPDGDVQIRLSLAAPEADRRAAILLPTFFGHDGSTLPPPYDGFAASPRFPAFRYLGAAPGGEENELTITPPPGTAKCRFELVPWLANPGFDVRLLDDPGSGFDGISLPTGGIVIERPILSDRRLRFCVWVLGAFDADAAATCSFEFLDCQAREIDGSAHYRGQDVRHQLVLGASREPSGRSTVVDLPPPNGAAWVRLTFQPEGRLPLRIRIEPHSDRGPAG